MNLGDTILRLRSGQGMSQEDLAAALDVSRQSVSKWETNASVPDLDKLIKLSALFGVTLDELVLGEKKVEPSPDPPAPVPEEPPPPEPEPPAVSTVQKVIGWLLLCIAAAAWLVLTMIAQNLLGFICALPFLLCGTICLTVKRNAILWCAWALFACVSWFFWQFNRMDFLWGQLAFLLTLLLVTAVRFSKRSTK